MGRTRWACKLILRQLPEILRRESRRQCARCCREQAQQSTDQDAPKHTNDSKDVPFTLVHFPTLPNPSFADKTGFGNFPDALTEMDARVGEILAVIDDLRIVGGGCGGA
jgi:hypothetical protein